MKKLIACLFLVIAFSCSTSDDETIEVFYELLPVESVQMPDEFIVGNVYDITLSYILPSTCYAFNNVYYLKEFNTRTVAIMSYLSPDTSNCQPTDIEDEVTITIRPEQSGTLTFRFWEGGDDYYVKEVQVVEN